MKSKEEEKKTLLLEPVMHYLGLIIPDTVETEASLGIIEKAEILPRLRN